MRPPREERQRRSRTVQTKIVDSAEWEQRIHDAIARRAFLNFESRGSSPGDASGDWRRAESEVVQLLDCGFVVGDNKVCVETDATRFDGDPIEIWAEPRRLTMCGKRGARAKNSPAEPVFYVLELPVAIDPSKVVTRFNGCVLMIDLPLREESRVYPQPRDEKNGFVGLWPTSGAMLH